MEKGTINKEYAKYQGKPEQIKNRSERNKARAAYEAIHGDQTGKDIDHKRPISKGGGNTKSNLRAVSPSANRSFSRTKTGKLKRND